MHAKRMIGIGTLRQTKWRQMHIQLPTHIANNPQNVLTEQEHAKLITSLYSPEAPYLNT